MNYIKPFTAFSIRIFILTVIIFIIHQGQLHSSTPDTIRVFSHRQTYITTNPSTGVNSYPAWCLFPGKTTQYRKILLRVTFECPEKLMCAEWDYLDHIYIRRTGSLSNPSADLEIGRMLTPYGRRFTSDWKFSWETDVSDFSEFLHDSTEIEYLHSGYEPSNDRGWRVTLEFICISGKPAMKFIELKKLYDGNFRYGDSIHSIEEGLQPVRINPVKGSTVGKFRIFQTGHGMDEKDGCSEFCAKWRNISWDHTVIDHRFIWKECASNPLYPQAGTWIFDRANWCPGELNQPDVFYFKLDTSFHTIDVDMQPYYTSNPSASYAISSCFVYYSKPVKKNDISVESIQIPSQKDIYRRINPTAHSPIITVSNSGSIPVHDLKIVYGFDGLPRQAYSWKGLLFPHEMENIELPFLELPLKRASFKVLVKYVNHRPDGYSADNIGTSIFEPVPVFPGRLIFLLRTNREPWQTSSFLSDESGNLIFQHLPGSLDSLRTYADTLYLKPGYYKFQVSDTAGDGLEFWYNAAAGRGISRILNEEGKLLMDFNPDFGNNTGTWFRVSDSEKTAIDTIPVLEVFPIRTTGKFSLDVFFNEVQPLIQVQIIHPDGYVAMMKFFYEVKEGLLPVDMRESPEAIYTVRIITRNREYLRRVKIAR